MMRERERERDETHSYYELFFYFFEKDYHYELNATISFLVLFF